MTLNEFNEKWQKHLTEGAYGLGIDKVEVINYLDLEFGKESSANPFFKYSQIKMKFGTCRIYTNSTKRDDWEKEINILMDLLN